MYGVMFLVSVFSHENDSASTKNLSDHNLEDSLSNMPSEVVKSLCVHQCLGVVKEHVRSLICSLAMSESVQAEVYKYGEDGI
jgi:hypothetical protein